MKQASYSGIQPKNEKDSILPHTPSKPMLKGSYADRSPSPMALNQVRGRSFSTKNEINSFASNQKMKSQIKLS